MREVWDTLLSMFKLDLGGVGLGEDSERKPRPGLTFGALSGDYNFTHGNAHIPAFVPAPLAVSRRAPSSSSSISFSLAPAVPRCDSCESEAPLSQKLSLGSLFSAHPPHEACTSSCLPGSCAYKFEPTRITLKDSFPQFSPPAAKKAAEPLPVKDCAVIDDDDPIFAFNQWDVGTKEDEENMSMIPRCMQLCSAVLCENTRPLLNYRSILGPTGHLERFSAWTHIFGSVAFAGYAIIRHTTDDAQTSSEEAASFWTTGAVWALAATFAASSIYHCTTPSKRLALITRQLDYLFIYISIVFGGLSDLAVVTRGFENVPWLTIVDVPLAAIAIALFFLYRRIALSEDETWQAASGCTLAPAFFYRLHSDAGHSPLRKASSLLLSLSAGLNIPALFGNVEDLAITVVLLQLTGFLVIVLGMCIDNVWVYPDRLFQQGKFLRFPFVCRTCGCVMNAHGIWHILALVGTILTVAAREVALSSFE